MQAARLAGRPAETHHVTILAMNGDSYRQRAALERKQHSSARRARSATIKTAEPCRSTMTSQNLALASDSRT